MLSSWKVVFGSINSACICRFTQNSFKNRYCTMISGSFPTNSIISKEIFLEQSSENDLNLMPKRSVLDELPVLEDVSHVGPPITYKSFNFAAYADECLVLQKLVDLGVDFYYIEKRNKRLPSYLLQLDFNRHIQPYIQFLLEKNVSIDKLGKFFSKNPFFFRNHLDDLQVRINYLQSKKFTNEVIADMLIKNPRLLNFKTVFIDNRLGYFQKIFHLKGFEVRQMASKYPPLLTRPQKLLTLTIFQLKDFSGFSHDECKNIILQQPYTLKLEPERLKRRLEFMTIDMELPLSLIASSPSSLVNRSSRLRERHLFLKSLGKAQYDPCQPKYIPLDSITHGNDACFCQFTAKTSVETYNLFLKTI